MTKVDEALESVLEGYASFLRERMLAPVKHQPYLVRWVQEYSLELYRELMHESSWYSDDLRRSIGSAYKALQLDKAVADSLR